MNTNVDTCPVHDAAKMLGIGSKKLFALLRKKQVLDHSNLPYQRYIDQGYFEVHQGNWEHPTIGTKCYGSTRVTANGLRWLSKFIDKNKEYEH